MLSVFSENIGSIAVLSVLLIVTGAVLARLIYNKKKGKSCCGSACAHCALRGKCHPDKKEDNNS